MVKNGLTGIENRDLLAYNSDDDEYEENSRTCFINIFPFCIFFDVPNLPSFFQKTCAKFFWYFVEKNILPCYMK